MIKNAIFTSVWDNGYEITSECKVNTETKEIFDIQMVDDLIDDEGDEVEILVREYVTIDGEDFDCARDDEDCEYWYK